MNKNFYLLPRGSGKTTKAIEQFVKDPENTFFVTFNDDVARQTFRRCSELYSTKYKSSNFMSCDKFVQTWGTRPSTIILDEYYLFTNRKEVYEYVNKMYPIQNLYIFSSPNDIHDENLIQLIKLGKQSDKEQLYLFIQSLQKNPLFFKMIDLYYDFLSDPDIVVFTS